MSDDAELDKWAEEIWGDIPGKCPMCAESLWTARFVREVREVRIRLTGVTSRTETLICECPQCGQRLHTKPVGDRQIHWTQ